ncbi:hypothetical protein [Burkholderia oklahomensis]|uniref:Uncharacterized protein n=1 Tax=Burkholderia oklahomensis TaxID=342113 RepID=A0AAI8FRC2_9BURK|nr:hypothetical protein [Burkholderia oklahomensis]AIO70576.1 hypothetical protein DM82_4867 [Burkholderia oklahomensis]AJX34232.1 hypothetical protein BG90_5729 [Burkholderia oklahomensis C6786]AOI39669.1 hypothetical protein WG70_08540 [Burkholderia oklahomensis EO147]AOI49356.1 hypothetical protein WI23_26630 [Burkholderia oklahomensis C6786]KUY51599.1 hypothetical protein WG70_16875 [Burkholderia oklahomensis EO147]
MKSLQIAVVALSLSAVMAAAHAQAAADAGRQPANRTEAVQSAGRVPAAHQDRKDPNECVGPVSFCNIYFGS